MEALLRQRMTCVLQVDGIQMAFETTRLGRTIGSMGWIKWRGEHDLVPRVVFEFFINQNAYTKEY